MLLRAGAAARDCPARSHRAPDAALSRFTAPTRPPPAGLDDATASDSNFTSFLAVTADWGCRRRKGGGGAADAGGGSSTFTRARGMCVDVGWCCWRVTGQQHAQEFVLKCFLRLRRLPSRATNNGGGGLRREFNIARKSLRATGTPRMLRSIKTYFDAEFHRFTTTTTASHFFRATPFATFVVAQTTIAILQ